MDYLFILVKPFGIITYVFIFLAALSGMFGRKIGLQFKHHRMFALAALGIATIHAAFVIIINIR